MNIFIKAGNIKREKCSWQHGNKNNLETTNVPTRRHFCMASGGILHGYLKLVRQLGYRNIEKVLPIYIMQ